MTPLESRWVTVDGRRIHARVCETAGPERPPIVLVHGLSMSARYMEPTAERLADHFQVYAPDLPGFGESEAPPHVLDVGGLAGALAGWMDASGLRQAVLVGNSLGCQVLLDLAVRRSDLVVALVLVGPTADPAGRWIPRLVGRAALDVFREAPSLYPIIVSEYLKAGVVRTWRTLVHLVEDRPEDRLGEVRVPTLVVRGAEDVIVPASWAEEVARRLPQGRLLTVEGAAHAVNYGAPARLAAAVRALVAEVEMEPRPT